jgi:hypothetical protein
MALKRYSQAEYEAKMPLACNRLFDIDQLAGVSLDSDVVGVGCTKLMSVHGAQAGFVSRFRKRKYCLLF